MKKILLSFCVLLTGSILFAQVQPTNASFENWTPATGFSNPDTWQTTNFDAGILGAFETTSEQTTGAQDGISFARLTTTDASGVYTLPGMITYGIIDIINATLTGGVPYTDKPEFFRGYYNYTPTGTDTCGIGCYFTKWNGTSADTVAIGSFYSDVPTTGWTMFDITIDYLLPVNPDTMNIIVSSSGTTPVIGSVLDVDNIYFEGIYVGVDEVNNNKLSIFPNPSNDIFNVNAFNINALEVIDITGKIVYSASYPKSVDNVKIDMSNHHEGIYMLRLKTKYNVLTRKLVLN